MENQRDYIQPDYMGDWANTDSRNLPTSYRPELSETRVGGLFYLFIESSENARKGTKFKGRIEDKFGNAAVEGEITKNLIIFTKQYDAAAIAEGGARGKLTYKGIKITRKGENTEFFGGLILYKEQGPTRTFIMRNLL